MTKITTEQFAILSDVAVVSAFGVNVTVGLKYNVEDRLVGILADFSFMDGENRFMILSVFCEFEIQQEDWESLKSDKNVIISRQALEYFVVQTIGTARGILHCKTEGTQFNNIIIPSVNVRNIVPDNMVIPLND